MALLYGVRRADQSGVALAII